MSFNRYHVLVFAVVANMHQTAFAQTSTYNLATAPLSQTIAKIARQNGVSLSADPELLKGKIAPAIQGNYDIDTAFHLALAESGLQLLKNADGTVYSLKRLEQPEISQPRYVGKLEQIDVAATKVAHQNTTQLPTIVITAENNKKVTLGKMEQSIKEIPQSVSIMNRDELDKRNLTDLSDALDKVTGVSLWQGSVFDDTFVSRGLEIQNIRVDGVSSALKLQDLSQFEQIEVLRGADGLFNGNGEPSASVNLVRKKPLKENQVMTELSAGSWNNYRTSLDVTGPIALDGALRGRLVGTWNDQDFFYEVAEKNRKSLYGILEYDILPKTTASIGFSYDKLQGKQDWIGLPRYIDGRDIGFDRKTSFIANWSNIEAESTQYFAALNHEFNDNWKLKLNVTKEHLLKLNEYSRLAGSVDPVTNMTSLSYIKNGGEPESWVADINIQGKFNLFGKPHSTVFGIDYQDKEDPFHYISGERSANYTFDVFNFDHDAAIARPISHDYKPIRTLYTKQLGLYGTVKWQITDPLKIITGARLNNYDFLQKDGDGKITYDYEDKNVFVPFIGLTYDLTKDWLVYASAAETFKSQADRLDVNKKPLDPITGRTYEIGLKGDLWDGQGNLSLSTYRTERKNEAALLYTETIDDGNGSSCCYASSGKARMSGLEIELTGEILPNLTGSVGYTYFDNKDDFKTISWRKITQPYHTLKAWLDYKIEDWTIGMNVSAQSEQYATGSTPTTYDANTGKWGAPYVDYKFSSPSHAIWGTQVSYQINPHLNASFRVNNLFDKVYWQTIGDASGYNWYGEPRNFMLTFRAKY